MPARGQPVLRRCGRARGRRCAKRPRSRAETPRPKISGSYPEVSVLGVGGLGDEPGSPAAGGEADRPADEDEEAVLEPDQVEEMDGQPGDPGQEAADLDALDVGDGGRTADGRQVAFVVIAERGRG